MLVHLWFTMCLLLYDAGIASHLRGSSQIPWRGVFLTPEGERLAQASRERHQIVESFLLVLGVSPEIARRDAEGMEHHVSEETLERFRQFTLQQGLPSE